MPGGDPAETQLTREETGEKTLLTRENTRRRDAFSG